jgi:putative transcriptional regulator
MTSSANLTDHFLIAMPQLADPNFFHTVTYICEHNSDGAMGIVINRPMEISLDEVFQHMEIPIETDKVAEVPVYLGGPVQPERGFVLASPISDWDSMLVVNDNVAIASSRDILTDIAANKGPQNYLVALGYAGWGAGQLEHEIAENAWLSGPASPEIIFTTPSEQRWESAAALLGIDLNLLSGDAGHA